MEADSPRSDRVSVRSVDCDMDCRFGVHCTRIDCRFQHSQGRTIDWDTAGTRPCKFGAACTRPDCRFLHSPYPCKFGAACSRQDCRFMHDLGGSLPQPTDVDDPASGQELFDAVDDDWSGYDPSWDEAPASFPGPPQLAWGLGSWGPDNSTDWEERDIPGDAGGSFDQHVWGRGLDPSSSRGGRHAIDLAVIPPSAGQGSVLPQTVVVENVGPAVVHHLRSGNLIYPAKLGVGQCGGHASGGIHSHFRCSRSLCSLSLVACLIGHSMGPVSRYFKRPYVPTRSFGMPTKTRCWPQFHVREKERRPCWRA